MKNAKICQSRKRRSVSVQPMSLGFGPLVVPEDQELANERPSAESLVDVIGEDSKIFAQEPVEVEKVEIERIEIVEVMEKDDFIKKRRSIIIACMAVGCFLLFILSVLISSRVSCICSKP